MDPRNYRIDNVELNWAKLDKPVNPFGTEQYELQIATTDGAVAAEWRENHLNVKEKDGKFTVSLKRKAMKADGSDNGKVRVVDANAQATAAANIGNGSIGNVIVFQYPYSAMGRSGIASSLTAVQIVKLEEYTPSNDFAPIDGAVDEPAEAPASPF